MQKINKNTIHEINFKIYQKTYKNQKTIHKKHFSTKSKKISFPQ